MAVKKEGQEVEGNPVLEDGLPVEGTDPKLSSHLEESQNEFEEWLKKIKSRREKSVFLLDGLREDLGRSKSWLKSAFVEPISNN